MQIAPYVSERRRRRKRIRAYLLGGLGVLALYGIFFVWQWFVIRSPWFRVDQVIVNGPSAVPSSTVLALVEAAADPSRHLFAASLGFANMMLWPDSVPTSSLRMAPELADVTIAKDYFGHTVTITAADRTPAGIWCFSRTAGGSCYWFDGTGTMFERSSDTQGELIYVVDDSAQNPGGLNGKILPEEFLPNFLSIINVLRQANLGVTSIQLTDLDLEEVDVHTANGPTIYFSLRFPADEYLSVIQKLMLQPNFGKLQYIDCRTQNRLYYK